MNISFTLECLLNKGYLSQGQYDAATKLVSSVPFADLDDLLSLVKLVESPSSMQDLPATTGAVVTPTLPASFSKVVVTAHNNNALFTVTGVDPTASFGHVLIVNNNYTFGKEFSGIRFLGSGGTADITITYYK